jgi:hypothetical protein
MLKISRLAGYTMKTGQSSRFIEKSVRFVSGIGTSIGQVEFADIARQFLSGLCQKQYAMPILAFLIPTFVRAIPEILMGSFVVGFDSLAYNVPITLQLLRGSVSFSAFIGSAPLFYLCLMGITYAGVPIALSVKMISPLLLGFLGLAVFQYAEKSLLWSSKKSLFAALFATLYFVALRVSWDMFRSELALIFLFISFLFLGKRENSNKNWLLLSLSMVAVVLAHQLVAVIMLFVILLTTIRLCFGRNVKEAVKLVSCAIPAVFFFLLVAVDYSLSLGDAVPFISVPTLTSNGWLSLFGFASQANLIFDTLAFLAVCYLPLFPIALLGSKRRINPDLEAWILWTLIAVSASVVSATVFFGILPYRWILLLTFPLAFVAVEGFGQLRKRRDKLVITAVLIFLSFSFVALPSGFTLPYLSAFSHYGPTSMLQNTVSLSDCQDTLNALHWVGENGGNDSCLLTHDAFYGWAVLANNNEKLIPYGYDDPEVTATELIRNGSGYRVYLIWWINGTGWHGLVNVPKSFNEVYRSGKIAIYSLNSGREAFSSEELSDSGFRDERLKCRVW